jgi:hypothetical protein
MGHVGTASEWCSVREPVFLNLPKCARHARFDYPAATEVIVSVTCHGGAQSGKSTCFCAQLSIEKQ